VFFDATAEYYRSDESSFPCAVPVSAGACAGQNTERTRGRLRIRLSGLHPRVGPEEVERGIASKLATRRATGAGSPNAFHSHYGPVLGLGPLSSQPCGWGTVERAAPSFVTSPASRRGDACSSRGRHLRGSAGPEPLRGFLLRAAYRVVHCKQRTTGQTTVRRGGPKVASRGVPTEVGPEAQDTQREHDDTSHGVRFLSARKAPVIVARWFT
jgi:hypothetical protein